ncbi:CHAT domain-containing protein [Flavilitoribacter nigricans]|uniref:CHAT domain-containing protein n=1 Tax=Flavilitoribacter nigricans (strain ATCC 23147 / DSM 23189 / NBRC 102662 / NCIMB 1420 / SS-2) TaxID=1122177 RepID=A0A2D0N632_FLAN2|nr:CHAT domain-containing protein [Flavilitoribacter nigricans]PHN03619.1 hypothetical protein CRP01_25510 [Flavilitoribacter nigricans DSM 23189 = NBRC 102662]
MKNPKPYWYILLAMLVTGSLSAQQTDPDSVRIEGYYQQLGQHCYTNLDSTLHYLDLLLEETHELGWTEEESYAYLWGILCTGYHDQIDLKYEFLSNAEQLLTEKGAELTPETQAAIALDLRMHWGDYYMETGGYNGALDIYESLAMALEDKAALSDEEFQRLVISYQYLATIHRLRGSYKEAIDYSFRALNYERQYYASRGEAEGDESLAYSRIANAYWLMGERARALSFYRPAFRRAREAYLADPAGKSRVRKRLINMGQELGRYYRELSRADSALYFLDAVAPYALPDEPVSQEIRLEKAKVWRQMGQFAKARDTLQLAIAKLEEGTQNRGNDFLLGQLYNEKGDIYSARQSYAEALRAYQRALTFLSDDFTAEDPAQNPLVTAGTAPQQLLYTLTQKTRILLHHPPENTADWLAAAWVTAQTGMQLVDSIKLSYTSDYDKQYLLEDSYQLYELALEIIHRQGSDRAEAAFKVMESSKAVALYAAVRDLHARNYAKVPERELEKVRRLQYQLARIDAQLDQATTEEQQITRREKKLAIKQEYDALIRSFEQKYPDYYRLKYDQSIVDLQDIDLSDDQLLVEYFVGDQHLYAFVYASGSVLRLLQLPWNADLQQWAAELKNDIYRQNDQAFAEKSFALYEALLAPILADADDLRRILIIPDGVLGYLPFDILLTEAVAPSSSTNFRDYPFLVRQLAVSQNFSLSMLREMQIKPKNDTDEVLAFAPSFSGSNAIAERSDRAVLGELLFNEEEAAAVLQSFEGRLVADRQATKDEFLALASRYRIYHIASHAVVDDAAPNNSYIAFASPPDSSAGFSRLYSYEILAQSFPADLVVLSACETGVGKVVRGEGIMSLARAFSYAGARSLVTSLWNINDQSGQQLMAEFYRQLSAGLPKDEALRQAKLSYLENAPDNARTHPKYWAAFIPTGNMESLSAEWRWQWVMLGLVVAGFFYFFLLKKRN